MGAADAYHTADWHVQHAIAAAKPNRKPKVLNPLSPRTLDGGKKHGGAEPRGTGAADAAPTKKPRRLLPLLPRLSICSPPQAQPTQQEPPAQPTQKESPFLSGRLGNLMLTLRRGDGQTVEVVATLSSTVGELQSELVAKCQLSFLTRVKIICGSKILPSNATVRECGLSEDSPLVMVTTVDQAAAPIVRQVAKAKLGLAKMPLIPTDSGRLPNQPRTDPHFRHAARRSLM